MRAAGFAGVVIGIWGLSSAGWAAPPGEGPGGAVDAAGRDEVTEHGSQRASGAPPARSPSVSGVEGDVEVIVGGSDITGETPAERLSRCPQVAAASELSLEARRRCAAAAVAVGDALAEAGARDAARSYWEVAARFDPQLVDSDAFMQRLRLDPGATAAGGGVPVAPELERPASTSLRLAGRVRPADAGPRWGRGVGLGLSFGFDGLAAISVSWLAFDALLAEASFGVAYPTVDLRARWFILCSRVTPVVGLGMLVPFSDEGRLGWSVGGLEQIYHAGTAVHLDVGVTYTPVEHLELFAGLTLVTSMTQAAEGAVLFSPQLTSGATWFF